MSLHTKIKMLAWGYLVIFSLMVLIIIVMETIAADFQAVFEACLMLLAPISLGIFLLRQRALLPLVLFAAIFVFMPISAAHKFWSVPEITLGMYVLFVPMLLGLIFVGWKNVQNKAT